MQDLKNYTINFINAEPIMVTSEEASLVDAAWSAGAVKFTINGESFACHQIISIRRIDEVVNQHALRMAKEQSGGEHSPNEIDARARDIRRNLNDMAIMKVIPQAGYDMLAEERNKRGGLKKSF